MLKNMPTILEKSKNYVENQIVWESEQEDIKRSKPYALVFYGPQRNPNKPPRYLYNKDFFFLKYRNSEERKYVLSLHKIHVIQFPEEDLEEKMNRWVRKEFKTFNKEAPIVEVVKITTEQHYGLDYMGQIIVMRENDKPDSFFKADFKYLNKNDIEDMYYLFLNKKVNYRENKLLNSLMTFIRSRKEFCKEVKLKIFETEFLKKAPLLGELDLEIMKAYDREITKRLRRRVYMRRWESFANGRPSLPTMRRQ
ncbi:hypothetical protein Tco_0157717 [Tanacetum coccineum]